MESKTISPHQPNSGSSISNVASPNITRRRIQEAIETDTDIDKKDNTTVFTKSSPRRKLQEAIHLDVDAGEVKEVSHNFISSILKTVISEQSKSI